MLWICGSVVARRSVMSSVAADEEAKATPILQDLASKIATEPPPVNVVHH
jgi:hypothetical protein